MKLQKVVYCLKKAVNVHTAFDDQQAVEALNTAIALIESEIDKQKSTIATKTHVKPEPGILLVFVLRPY